MYRHDIKVFKPLNCAHRHDGTEKYHVEESNDHDTKILKGGYTMSYDEIYDKTKEIIVDYLRVDENEVTPETNIVDDLFADSIALVELGFRFSETFSIPIIEGNPELFVMKELVDFIHKKIQE